MRDLSALASIPWAMEESRLQNYWRQLPACLAKGVPNANELQTLEAAASTKLKAVRGKVAVLPLVGVIEQRMSLMSFFFGGVSTEMVGAVIDEMLARKEIDAIVLDVDSPGGSIAGVEELADKLHQARAVKPIYSVSNSDMYSAAYWIGSSATKTFVTNGGGVGSVGVYMMHVDYTQALQADGIGVEFIRKPDQKADVNPYESLTDSAREHMQAIVADGYDKFVSAVARNRGVNARVVREKFGNGRIVLAKQALAAGMVDGIKTRDQLLSELQGAPQAPGSSRGRASAQVLRLRAEQRKRKAAGN